MRDYLADPGSDARMADVQVGWAKTGWNPHGIAISPNGAFAYVTNTWMPVPDLPQRSTVTRVELRAWREHLVVRGDTLWGIAAAQLGSGHRWPEIFESSWAIRQPDGRYLTNPDLIRPGWTLHVPIAEGETTAEVGVGDYPTSVVFTPDGAYAYVANFYGNSLSCIRTSDNHVVATIGGLDGNPWALAMSPAAPGGAAGAAAVNTGDWFLYVTQYAAGKVSRVDIPADPATGSHTVTTLSQVGCLQWAVPWGVAIHAEADGGAGRMLAYVTDYASRTVACIDTADNTLADTYDLPGRQAMGVTVSPDGRHLYVALRDGGRVVRIDTTDRTRTVTQVGQDPWALALSPDGSVLYVTVGGASRVALLAAAQPQMQQFAHADVGLNPMGVAVGANDDYALVVDTGSHWVSKLRGAPAVLVTTFLPPRDAPTGSPPADPETHPHGVAIRPTGPADTVQVWLTNSSDDAVAVVQAAPRGAETKDTVRDPITVGSQPWGVAFRPDGALACTSNTGSGDVSVISTTTYTETRRLAVGGQPRGLAFHPEGAWAYVVLGAENRVACLDPNVAIGVPWVTALIDVGSDPWDVAMSPGGTFAYVTNKGSNTISVIDTATHQVIKTIQVGAAPMGVTFPRLPMARIALVAVSGEGAVKRIDTATHTVAGSVPVGGEPHDVALSSDGRFGYVTVGADNCIKHIHMATNAIATTLRLTRESSNPMQVAISPGGTFAYAAIHDGSVDPISHRRRGSAVRIGHPVTIDVGAPAWHAAITGDGARAYVTLPSLDTVAAVDFAPSATVDEYQVAPHPWHIALTPDQTRAYLTHGTDLDDNCVITSDLVTRITLPTDPATHPTVTTYEMTAVATDPPFEPGCYPWGITATQDRVFLTMRYQQPHLRKGEVVEFTSAADTLTPVNRCTVAGKAGGVMLDPGAVQRYLHVGMEQREDDIPKPDDWNHATLLSIDRSTSWTQAYTPLDGVPFAFDFGRPATPFEGFAYVVCYRPKPPLKMTLVRLTTSAQPPVYASYELPSDAYGLAIFPDGRHAYLALKGTAPGASEPDPGDVLLLSTRDESVESIVHASYGPKTVTIAADGSFAVVTNRYETHIQVI